MDYKKYEQYKVEVETGDFKNWKLETPYFKWEKGRIISCDACVAPETNAPADTKILISKNWCSFGATAKEASNALYKEIITPMTEQNPTMVLVVLEEFMEPFTTSAPLTGMVDCGFCAGFSGGFAQNPIAKSLT